MAAFNAIEDRVRERLGAAEHEPFATLLPKYADKRRLTREQRNALTAFASLRNAIAHGRYYSGRPIAEPVEDVVLQIERLRDQIESPPLAYALTRSIVSVANPSQPISAVLAIVREHGYSQLPVYANGRYVSLLTTNAIARWLANQWEDPDVGLAEDRPVSAVLPFVEPHEVAVHVPRTITAAEAIDRLSRGGSGGRPVVALIITHSGRQTEQPLAVLVADDLPELASSLALT